MTLTPCKSFALLTMSLVALQAAAATAPPAHPPPMVVLARPLPSPALAEASGAVTLSYEITEVFVGEPSGTRMIVRHEDLGAGERSLLQSGAGVILLATPDLDSPGRYLAPAPALATEEALAAFRSWSAPAEDAVPIEEEIVRARADEVPVRRAATPDPLPRPAAAAPRPSAPAPSCASLSAPRAVMASAAVPATLHPAHGPGLPPSPAARVLGPGLDERADLPLRREGRDVPLPLPPRER